MIFWPWNRNNCLLQTPGDSVHFPCCPTPCQHFKTAPDAKWMQSKLDPKISRMSKLHSSRSDPLCRLWFWIPYTHTAACFCDMFGCFRSQQIKLLGHRTKVPLWEGLGLGGSYFTRPPFCSFSIRLLSNTSETPSISRGIKGTVMERKWHSDFVSKY